ncbi:3,4-dihydroxyphenylacetaldehyde synthase 2-like [Anastrepha obliqua]|uniref:3,4-dihydroxyphenylacetaldehyde synthase 2-like n=1 Tax=Anastrepha obliqua TaxID=95512 RepID=UPI00240A2B0D|nr:3,4-dihydroxyphenylacetaldehyde synthase 2-like [Anastrepha obliqua]
MDAQTFREFGKAAVDFIADYMENIRDCDVLPSVAPGYLFDLLPEELPEKPEQWKEVLQDINKFIKPGLTHWQSPNFHAFYPTGCSYPSIVGEMLATGFSVIGFNWLCSPACTELEVIVMDWLAKFLKLPAHFLHSTKGPGGGIIQGSASEAVLVAVMAAREQAVRRVKVVQPELSEGEIRARLIGYSSDQSNSCIEKAGVLATLPIRLLPADENQVLGGAQLAKAVQEDLAKGLIPTICIATMGATGTCAYDDIETLAPICEANKIWLHVDAAYAGAALALDEYAHLGRGLDRADSLNYNLHKSLLINFDCTAMWLRDSHEVVESFNVNRIYLQNKYDGQTDIPEFRNWQIPLGRRFRALKVWVTFRIYGAEGLRAHVRKQIRLAERFEQHMLGDQRLELVAKRAMGLVCFRVKGDNKLTTDLLQRITERKKIYMVQAAFGGRNFIRFVVCGMDPKEADVDFAWDEIETQLNKLLSEQESGNVDTIKIQARDVEECEIEKSGDVKLKTEEMHRKDDEGAISQQLSSGLHITKAACEKSK